MRLLTLGTDIAELSKCSVEQAILLPERGLVALKKRLLVSCFHIRIRDLRDAAEEEDPSEEEHKTCDAEVYKLNALQCLHCVLSASEEHV